VRGLRDLRSSASSDKLSRGHLVPNVWKGKFPDVYVWDAIAIDDIIAVGGLAASVNTSKLLMKLKKRKREGDQDCSGSKGHGSSSSRM
jgi:hypothetical protein